METESHKKNYRCFIASPGDVVEEREVCRSVIESLRQNGHQIEAIGWEDLPPNINGQEAQDWINQAVASYDLFVGIMANKFGTPTENAPSGTVEEFNIAFKEYRVSKSYSPWILFYFKDSKEVPLSYVKDRPKVDDFRKNICEQHIGLLGTYTNTENFEKHLKRNLEFVLGRLNDATSKRMGMHADSIFIERDIDFVNLQNLLSKKHVMIQAQGGIGKTTLIQHFLSQPEIIQQYPVVRWLTLSRDSNSTEDSKELRRVFVSQFGEEQLNVKKLNEQFKDCIETSFALLPGRNRLLVIDNLDFLHIRGEEEDTNDEEEDGVDTDYGDYDSLKMLLKGEYGWKILILTRGLPELDQDCDVNNLFLKIHLTHLTEDSCIQLFKRVYERDGRKGFHAPSALMLIKKIDYNSKLIRLLAAGARVSSARSFKDYCTDSIHVIKTKGVSVFLKSLFDSFDPFEKELLCYIVALTSKPISRTMLHDTLQSTGFRNWGKTLDSLISKQWIDELEGQVDTKEESDTYVSYSCHRLPVMYFKNFSNITTKSINKIVKAMSNLVCSNIIIPWIEVAQWTPYAKSLLDSISSIQDYDDDMLSLGYEYLNTSISANELSVGDSLNFARSLINEVRARGRQKLLLALLYRLEADLLVEKGCAIDRTNALRLRQNCLDILDELRADSDSEELKRQYGQTLDFIGRSYRTLGNYTESLKNHQDSIKILLPIETKISKVTLASAYDHLGLLYSENKEFELSLEWREKALNLKRQYLKETDSSYISTWNNYGHILQKLGRYKDALEVHKNILNVREKVYPKYHPARAYSYNNLALSYSANRDFKMALEYSKKAEEVLNNAISYPNRRKGVVYRNRAKIFLDFGMLMEAENCIQLAHEYFQDHGTEKDKRETSIRHEKIKKSIAGFCALEQQYWSYKKSLKLSNDLKPVNLSSERERFFYSISQGECYNPQFNYAERSRDEVHEIVKQLQNFKQSFNEVNLKVLTDAYCKLIDKDIQWIKLFEQRSSKTFGRDLTQMYLPIDPNVIEKAEQIISTFDTTEVISKPTNDVEALEVKRRFELVLRERGYMSWQVELVDQPARVSVNSVEQKIKLRNNARFSEEDIQRLIVHEIDVHVARSEEGYKKPFLIFAYGFPNYLEAEEGLAAYKEEEHGLSSKRKIYDYAVRALLCSKAESLTFYELYQEALQLYPQENELAYDIAVRIKRGLSDTSQFGGYTKDRIYLSGYLKIKSLSEEERKSLSIGKIGVDDIPNMQYLST